MDQTGRGNSRQLSYLPSEIIELACRDVRHRSANANRRQLERGQLERAEADRGAPVDERRVAGTLRGIVDGWTVEGFQNQRATLDHVRKARLIRVEAFVEALYGNDVRQCMDLTADAFAECANPQAVAHILFAPAADSLGEAWSRDRVDFLAVTLAMTSMQRLFRQLAADHPPLDPLDFERRVLLAPSPGDQHTFGLSIVEDAFQRNGWDVDFCCEESGSDLVRSVTMNHYLVIGLSVSVGRPLQELASLVKVLRARSLNRSVVLMAGGGLTSRDPLPFIEAGFDLVAVDAISAVRDAASIVQSIARLAARTEQ